jgi:hypothetical protein
MNRDRFLGGKGDAGLHHGRHGNERRPAREPEIKIGHRGTSLLVPWTVTDADLACSQGIWPKGSGQAN